MPSTLTPTTRDALVTALIQSDLRASKGSSRALMAWQELEWRRCAADPLYWFDHYVYIMVKENGRIEKMHLFPDQREFISDLHSGHNIVGLKSRQGGFTTCLALYRQWKVLFLDAARCNFVSDSEEKGKEAMVKMMATFDRLPSWMKDRAASKAKEGDVRRKDKREGTLGISFGLSELKVLTSTPNSVAGVSGDIDLDEFGRHRDQERVYFNALPAIEGGGQMVILGNGNGEDKLAELFKQADAGNLPGFKARFWSWKCVPTRLEGENRPYLVTEINKAAGNLPESERVHYTEGEPIPKGKVVYYPWYETEKQKFLGANPDKNIFYFKAQHPSSVEEALYLSGDEFFDGRMVNGLSQLAQRHHPRVVELRNEGEDDHLISRFSFLKHSSGRIRAYADPVSGRRYVCGVDPTGDGKNGDFAVVTMAEFVTGEEVTRRAEKYGYLNPPAIDGEPPFRFKDTDTALDVVAVFQARTEPVVFSHEVERFCRHYEDAFAVIERNNSGGTVVSHIKDSYWNLYRAVKTETKFSDDQSDVIGYWETEASKKRMLDNLNWWLSNGWIFLHDSPTISELGRFGYNERGQLRAPKGLHDDLVFGLGLCVVGAMDLMVAKSDGDEVNYGIEW